MAGEATTLGLARRLGIVQGGGVDLLQSILSPNGEDYAFFDFTKMANLYQDNAGATSVTAIGQVIGLANVIQKAPHKGSQATASAKPTYQTTGAKFDGSDDSLFTDWLFQTGENCAIIQATMPTTVSTNQSMYGSQNTARNRLDIISTGQLQFAIGGSGSPTTGPDYRGQSIIVLVTMDGTTVNVIVDTTPLYSLSQSTFGQPDTTTAVGLGSVNVNGTMQQRYGGSIKRIAFGKKAISNSQFQQIRNQWLAAA